MRVRHYHHSYNKRGVAVVQPSTSSIAATTTPFLPPSAFPALTRSQQDCPHQSADYHPLCQQQQEACCSTKATCTKRRERWKKHRTRGKMGEEEEDLYYHQHDNATNQSAAVSRGVWLEEWKRTLCGTAVALLLGVASVITIVFLLLYFTGINYNISGPHNGPTRISSLPVTVTSSTSTSQSLLSQPTHYPAPFDSPSAENEQDEQEEEEESESKEDAQVEESDGEVWFLNVQESKELDKHRARRSLLKSSGGGDTSATQSLAFDCGRICHVHLRAATKQPHLHVGYIASRELLMEFTRLEENESDPTYPSSTTLVQYMDSDGESTTLTNHSNMTLPESAPNQCLYAAKLMKESQPGISRSGGQQNEEAKDSHSIVNLCSPRGGLFGTLHLPEGTFTIEPLPFHSASTSPPSPNRESESDFVVNGSHAASGLYSTRHRRSINPAYRNSNQRRGSGGGPPQAYLIAPIHFGASSHEAAHQQHNNQQLNGSNPHQPAAFFQRPSGGTYDGERVKRRRRTADSWDHFVEVLVVADHKMLVYHQGNLENYLLTLFSTVASIYRHPTLGASVNIVVVRIVILRHERAGPRITNRAQDTLQEFCNWQRQFNDETSTTADGSTTTTVNSHDVAILLTRHDICRASNKCDTLGLAELGTMCDSRKSCAIIEDNGLSAAFTIAHELGHIFNLPHDDEPRCGEHMALNKQNFHIMAPTLEYNTNPWSWSPCSAYMLARFLDTASARSGAVNKHCLYNKPAERRYFERMFGSRALAPGALYDVDAQCQLVFGSAAKICPYMPTCRRLWCSVSIGFQMGCRTQHMPWAEGTPCAKNMWCHRGQCVGLSPAQRAPQDGQWGEWHEWGECSRTCGGGIQKAYRECDSPAPLNGGKYCTGKRERYRSCNINECPWSLPDIRELQCAEFNGRDIGIHGVAVRDAKWVPKYTGINTNERCRLYCRAVDSSAFYLLKEKVLDGTPCDRNTDDVCIDGACHPAGCDHRLDSPIRRDACGICGGDGSGCSTVEGTYNEKGSFGYNEVVRIPAGAANIEITQQAYNNQKEDDTYIALSSTDGEFLLNGHYQVSVFRQEVSVLDAMLEYSGSDHPVERVNGSGPIHADLYLHVLSVGNLNPPHIHYRYNIIAARPPLPLIMGAGDGNKVEQRAPPPHDSHRRRQPAPRPPRPHYWQPSENEWSECSARCQGRRQQRLACMDAMERREVNEAYCAGEMRPAVSTLQQACNVDCFFKWEQRTLSNDVRRPRVEFYCVRAFRDEYAPEERAHNEECISAGLQRPSRQGSSHSRLSPPSSDHQQPPAGQKPARWSYTEWSSCSESCGNRGNKQRTAHCLLLEGGGTEESRRVDPRHCDSLALPKESTITECNRFPCPQWVYGHWSECSRPCDGGIRMRHAVCRDSAGRSLAEKACAGAQGGVFHDKEECNMHACTKWSFGPWSTCSASCGTGVREREARCVDSAGRAVANETLCSIRERIVQQQCQQPACPRWKLGEWSGCSASCLGGYMSRVVTCVGANEQRLPDEQCIRNFGIGGEKPASHQACNQGPCPHWRLGGWSRCSVSCGRGTRRREVECLHNGQERPTTHLLPMLAMDDADSLEQATTREEEAAASSPMSSLSIKSESEETRSPTPHAGTEDRRRDNAEGVNEMGQQPKCRICLGEYQAGEKGEDDWLLQPCRCAGRVHHSCLARHIEHVPTEREKTHCLACGSEYRWSWHFTMPTLQLLRLHWRTVVDDVQFFSELFNFIQFLRNFSAWRKQLLTRPRGLFTFCFFIYAWVQPPLYFYDALYWIHSTWKQPRVEVYRELFVTKSVLDWGSYAAGGNKLPRRQTSSSSRRKMAENREPA